MTKKCPFFFDLLHPNPPGLEVVLVLYPERQLSKFGELLARIKNRGFSSENERKKSQFGDLGSSIIIQMRLGDLDILREKYHRHEITSEGIDPKKSYHTKKGVERSMCINSIGLFDL